MTKKIWILLALSVLVGGVGAFAYTSGNLGSLSLATADSTRGAFGDLFVTAYAAPAADPGEGAKDAPPADEKAADGSKADAPKAAAAGDDDLLAKLENWKKQDPRDLMKAKFDDLESKTTKPWDEDNPETYIPETGRVDPLTRVRDAVPDELKPPRTGDSDQNEIESYLFSAAATQAVDGVAAYIQVYNVVQIGLRKLVTIGGEGQPAQTVEEGASFSFQTGGGGFYVNVTITIVSVSSDGVVMSITGQPMGSNVSITKNVEYIPGAPSGGNSGNGRRGGGGGGGGGQAGPRG